MALHDALNCPAQLQLQQQADGGVHAIQTISDGQGESMSVDLTEATLGQDGQLIITGEDGQGIVIIVLAVVVYDCIRSNNTSRLHFSLSQIDPQVTQ